MNRVVVYQVHVLLQSVVHEGKSVPALGIIRGQRITLVLVPLDLVSSNAIHASVAHAVGATSPEEPQTCISLVLVTGVLNGKIEGELMVHLFAVVLVEVGQRGRVFPVTFELEHLDGVNISFEVVEARHYGPGHRQVRESLSQEVPVRLPEPLRSVVPGLAADDVSCDGDEVGLLLVYKRGDHMQGL